MEVYATSTCSLLTTPESLSRTGSESKFPMIDTEHFGTRRLVSVFEGKAFLVRGGRLTPMSDHAFIPQLQLLLQWFAPTHLERIAVVLVADRVEGHDALEAVAVFHKFCWASFLVSNWTPLEWLKFVEQPWVESLWKLNGAERRTAVDPLFEKLVGTCLNQTTSLTQWGRAFQPFPDVLSHNYRYLFCALYELIVADSKDLADILLSSQDLLSPLQAATQDHLQQLQQSITSIQQGLLSASSASIYLPPSVYEENVQDIGQMHQLLLRLHQRIHQSVRDGNSSGNLMQMQNSHPISDSKVEIAMMVQPARSCYKKLRIRGEDGRQYPSLRISGLPHHARALHRITITAELICRHDCSEPGLPLKPLLSGQTSLSCAGSSEEVVSFTDLKPASLSSHFLQSPFQLQFTLHREQDLLATTRSESFVILAKKRRRQEES
jgi:hypothetical protein